MSKPEGIYLSADFRVTELPSGRLIDDASVKLLQMTFVPVDAGTRGLLAYTGVAMLPGGLSAGTWLVETMRGEAEVPDAAMAHLRSRLDRDIAPLRLPLIVNMLLIEGDRGERRLFGGFTNLRWNTSRARVEVLPRFEYLMQELTEPFVFANGSGAVRVIADQHMDLLKAQLSVHPRRAFEHMKLLAAVNRRVAAKTPSVSPACHVAFIPAQRPRPGVSYVRFGAESHSFTKRGESAPVVMPLLFAGIDLSFIMRQGMEQLASLKSGETPPAVDPDEVNRELRRRD